MSIPLLLVALQFPHFLYCMKIQFITSMLASMISANM